MIPGIRQGDLRSPILFNLMIDVVIYWAKQIGVGVYTDNHRTPKLAFTDDLILTATTTAGLHTLIDTITDTVSVCGT